MSSGESHVGHSPARRGTRKIEEGTGGPCQRGACHHQGPSLGSVLGGKSLVLLKGMKSYSLQVPPVFQQLHDMLQSVTSLNPLRLLGGCSSPPHPSGEEL